MLASEIVRRKIFSSAVVLTRCCVISLMAVIAGCGGGDDGPTRYRISGKVTFGGQPVRFGSIVFEPDAGNKGPQGFAEIHDGGFDTRKENGTGVISGKMVARITGFDRDPPPPSNDEPVVPLFEEYSVKLDLPTNDSTKDFDVPKQAGDKTSEVHKSAEANAASP